MSFFTSLLNSLPGVKDTTNALIAFFTTITDYRMWRSLGWLLLGIIMIAAGLALLARNAATGTATRILQGR